MTLLLPGTLVPAAWIADASVQAQLARLSWIDLLGQTSRIDSGKRDDDSGPLSAPRHLPHECWLAHQVPFITCPLPATVWFASPVRLAVGLDHLVLEQSDLAITQRTSDRLAQAIAGLLEEDGIVLERLRAAGERVPEIWKLHFPSALTIQTASGLAALGRNTRAFMPEGPDARRWQKLLNEVEMAWHLLAEQAPQTDDFPLPNSLWLAQATTFPNTPTRQFTSIRVLSGGDTLSQYRLAECTESAPPEIQTESRRLLVDASALPARLSGDLGAWLAALEAIDLRLAELLGAAPAASAPQPKHPPKKDPPAVDFILTGEYQIKTLRCPSPGASAARNPRPPGAQSFVDRLAHWITRTRSKQAGAQQTHPKPWHHLSESR
jgi:hypothetical protein